MNSYLRGLNIFFVILFILGGIITVIALANANGDYNPAGALGWAAFGGSLLGFGVFVVVMWATASAIVTGVEAPEVTAKAKQPATEPEPEV